MEANYDIQTNTKMFTMEIAMVMVAMAVSE